MWNEHLQNIDNVVYSILVESSACFCNMQKRPIWGSFMPNLAEISSELLLLPGCLS